jgi:hypothetical protein
MCLTVFTFSHSLLKIKKSSLSAVASFKFQNCNMWMVFYLEGNNT